VVVDLAEQHSLSDVERYLRSTTAREDALQTRLVAAGGGDVTIFLAASTPVLEVVDVHSREDALAEVEAMTLRLFERYEHPLWSAAVIRYGANDEGSGRLLCLVFDHLIADTNSAIAIKPFLQRLRWPERGGRASYREWLIWQRTYFSGSDTREGRFWRHHLDGTPARRSLDLPFALSGAEGRLGPVLSTSIRCEVSARDVAAACGRARATEFMFLLGAATAATASVSASEDFTLHIVTAGRAARFAHTFGGLSSQVPVRLRGRHLNDPLDAFALARATWLDVLSNDAPWEYIVRQGSDEVAAPQKPYSIVINLVSGRGLAEEMVDATVTLPERSRGDDLWLEVVKRTDGGGYDLSCEYESDRFPEPSIRALLDAIASTWRWLLTSS
jgi:hypothetical protein